ncbi:ATP phosphoribosyltransferase regulatory subunit [Alicyclobacillus sp. SP_1]|uniref:ATP phosphoribosyltransferase regulatory subunit n=1 Tax=Alicyclobacillus sp. SP_1 TaxID=2942475 RepID=UPI002157029B|nr:ATP phosphoribosyltransferase regulatory subunit [Alicyclobacillus sp. SP_1]
MAIARVEWNVWMAVIGRRLIGIEQWMEFADKPLGMQDGYAGFAKQRRVLESTIVRHLEREGHELVSCGAFEYVETLLRARPVGPLEQWVQWVDASGRAVALRPEMTPSIARMAAPLVSSGQRSLRWSYAERVYRRVAAPTASLQFASGSVRESTQVGVEWIGGSGVLADVRLLELCHSALREAGLAQAHTVLSHARIAPLFLAAVGISQGLVAQLLALLHAGKYVDFEELAGSTPVHGGLLSALRKLRPEQPRSLEDVFVTFGKRVSPSSDLVAAWSELVELAARMRESGLSADMTFDLTFHRDVAYYTGLIFETFAPGVGVPIALGGRYDHLLQQFGAEAPAVGFAFELEQLMEAKGMAIGWSTRAGVASC